MDEITLLDCNFFPFILYPITVASLDFHAQEEPRL